MIGLKYPLFAALVLVAITFALLAVSTNVVFAQSCGGTGQPPCCTAPNVPPGCQGGSSGGTGGSTSVVTTLTSQLCGIVNGVRTVIGVIALVMFLVGGTLYAVGHFMPAAGQIKASMQGWAMGMILGGVIGVVLVILAPFIISTILNFGSGLSALAC
ncbi:MAG: hypothetical protein KGH71_00605 [Candidatus Micrarchaeota archaeon]|nr:hypothetical protein [Candidatus Micrarchaeota archaeon]